MLRASESGYSVRWTRAISKVGLNLMGVACAAHFSAPRDGLKSSGLRVCEATVCLAFVNG